MVSFRCKLAVKQILETLCLKHGTIDLGEVEVLQPITTDQLVKLRKMLLQIGLELMQDKKAILVEKIKVVIIEMVHFNDEPPEFKNSAYISKKLHRNYTYLSMLFSETTGITIEQFIMAQKIERVKELLMYNELNLTEIAYKLHYSSVAHLSLQFKKVTGFTPTYYKKLKGKRILGLDDM